MQITLKQTDIEKSLKDYIAAQGIRIEGKDVSIVFTAGRRGTGVTAEIAIEDAVNCTAGFVKASDFDKNPDVLADCGPAVAYRAIPEPELMQADAANEPEPVPVKTTSLFG